MLAGHEPVAERDDRGELEVERTAAGRDAEHVGPGGAGDPAALDDRVAEVELPVVARRHVGDELPRGGVLEAHEVAAGEAEPEGGVLVPAVVVVRGAAAASGSCTASAARWRASTSLPVLVVPMCVLLVDKIPTVGL